MSRHRVMDFKAIWNSQNISLTVEQQIVKIAEAMYNHLVSPEREVENVTEWAKRESCWRKAKDIEIRLSNQFAATLIAKEEEKEEQRAAKKDQKHMNQASAMIKVAEYGAANWRNLLKWGTENHILTPQEISFIKVAISMESGKFPSEKQCIRIMQILNRARIESFPD